MSIKLSHAAAAKNKQLENIRKPNQPYTLHFNFSFCQYVWSILCSPHTNLQPRFSNMDPNWEKTIPWHFTCIRSNPVSMGQGRTWVWPSPPEHLRPWIASNHLIDLIQQRFNLGAALKIRSFHLQLVGDWWENKWMQSYKYTICITNDEFHCLWNYIRFTGLISVCWWKFSDTFCKFLQIGEARVRLLHDAVWTKASLRHRLRVGRLLWGWQCQHVCLAFALGFGLPTTLKQFHKVGYLRVLMLMVLVFFQMLDFFHGLLRISKGMEKAVPVRFHEICGLNGSTGSQNMARLRKSSQHIAALLQPETICLTLPSSFLILCPTSALPRRGTSNYV